MYDIHVCAVAAYNKFHCCFKQVMPLCGLCFNGINLLRFKRTAQKSI